MLFLKLRLLNSAFQRIKARHIDEPIDLINSIKHFPWVASPLQKGPGPFFFWSIIGIGFVLLAEVAYAHATYIGPMPDTFVHIGYLAAAVFLVSLILIIFMVRYLQEIQKQLDEIEKWAAEQPHED